MEYVFLFYEVDMKIAKIITIIALHCSVNANAETNNMGWHEQKVFFQENGYLWIKDFFSIEQVQLLQNWADEIHRESEATLQLPEEISQSLSGTLVIVPEAKHPKQACRAEDLCTIYPELYHFVRGTVTAYISYILDEPYVLFKDKINFKWPGGGAFLPHQDFPAYENFGPREHVTAMVCIDPATLENGCLQVAKNWNQGNTILPYVTGGPSHGSIDPKCSNELSWLPLLTSTGDLVLINSYIPHYSEVNHSQKPRRAMFFTHNRLKEGDHRCAYYHAKRHDPHNPVFHFATPTKARNKETSSERSIQSGS
jgi:ectoine hydroxylase-related dioxygenase (phytanoyl-CoA dioxygenase family)